MSGRIVLDLSAPSQIGSSAVEATNTAAPHAWTLVEWLRMPAHWPAQTDLLTWAANMSPGAAAALLIGGAVYLLFGFYLFKQLVTLNATMVGAFIGYLVGGAFDSGEVGAVVGGFLAAALCWTTMKYCVALMGGVFGMLLGISVWRLIGLEPQLAWAGALSGLLAFGMIAFILFRTSVMMYTSLQGSVMVIFGLLGLIYKYQSIAPQVTKSLSVKPFLLPLAIFVPAILGMIYQQSTNPAGDAGGGKKK